MTIGEFSVITGISAYTLRYYEKKGLLRVSRDSIGKRMELLIQHRKSVVEEKRKWEEYLWNLDEKIGIYQERIDGKSEEFCGRKKHEP